jgi:cytochrome c553
MFHINSNFANGLTLLALLLSAEAFAQSDATSPYMGIIGGRISPEVNSEREETAKLRNRVGNPVAGREKSQLCQGCHGEFGNSTNPLIPKLAGQFGNYISKQVHNYQSGTRSHQIMSAMAATISNEDLVDIAAYFSSQNKMKGGGSVENQMGKSLFTNNDISSMKLACINCHGERGQGLEPQISAFPVIGGQHKDYIRQQLINFRAGNRTNTPNDMMNRMAGSLTDAEIESLAEYVSQQPASPAEPIPTPVDHRKRTRKPLSN